MIVARLDLAGNAGLRIDKQRGGSIISRAARANLACGLLSLYPFPLIASLYWAGHVHLFNSMRRQLTDEVLGQILVESAQLVSESANE